MERYSQTNIKKDLDTNRRMYVTTLYPKIAETDNDIYIISREGDRLDLLADSYYNDASMWWIIAQANAIGKGTLWIKPGLQLRIPSDTNQILIDYNTLNETR